MKKQYMVPELEIIAIAEDVVCTSGDNIGCIPELDECTDSVSSNVPGLTL